MNTVATYRITSHGKARWLSDYRRDGRRYRAFHDTRQQAEAAVARAAAEMAEAGAAWVALDASERMRLMSFWRETQALGTTPEEVMAAWRKAGEVGSRVSVGATVKELLTVKNSAGASAKYRDGLRLVLGQFIRGQESAPIESLTFRDVEAFLESKRLASRQTLRSRISTLFRFAVRRGYVRSNPCDRLERVRAAWSSPEILTPMQAARCLVYLRRNPRGMAWFVLTCFCGLRPEEAARTSWRAVRGDCVAVEAQTTKVRQRRIVHPHATALAWLDFARKLKADLPISGAVRRGIVRELRGVLRLKAWPKDVTRHTAASYWLAVTQDSAFVAEQLGNSVDVLKKHYKALVTREQAERFWGISPPANDSKQATYKQSEEKAEGQEKGEKDRNSGRVTATLTRSGIPPRTGRA